jgi:hypothetical protein
MLGSIAEKMKDALLMFWLNLSEEEKRALFFWSLYVSVSLVFSLTEGANKERERKRMRDEIVTELKANG